LRGNGQNRRLEPELEQSPPATLQYQVRTYLLELIRSGKVRPGGRLPTEQELERRFGVSRITVRNAVAQLEHMGVLFRRAGLGTFVAQPKIEQKLQRLTGFVEDMDALGVRAGAQLVQAREVRSSVYVATKLKLKRGALVTHIERVRLADDRPLSFDVTYLPAQIGRRIAKENLAQRPIFELLEAKYKIYLGDADYAVEAANASPAIAKRLQIAPGDAILLVERLSYDRDGRPIDYEKLHYRGDMVRYRLRVSR
jgi:GntR family transcriptional regulator